MSSKNKASNPNRASPRSNAKDKSLKTESADIKLAPGNSSSSPFLLHHSPRTSSPLFSKISTTPCPALSSPRNDHSAKAQYSTLFKSDKIAKAISESFSQQLKHTDNDVINFVPSSINSIPVIIPYSISTSVDLECQSTSIPLLPLFAASNTTSLTLHPECWYNPDTVTNSRSTQYFDHSTSIDRIATFYSPSCATLSLQRGTLHEFIHDNNDETITANFKNENRRFLSELHDESQYTSEKVRLNRLLNQSLPLSAIIPYEDTKTLSSSPAYSPRQQSPTQHQSTILKDSTRRKSPRAQTTTASSPKRPSRQPSAIAVGKRPSVTTFSSSKHPLPKYLPLSTSEKNWMKDLEMQFRSADLL